MSVISQKVHKSGAPAGFEFITGKRIKLKCSFKPRKNFTEEGHSSIMTSKSEKSKMKIPFVTSPIDEWLDEKKKLDGAEGLWRIHDKLYDFTIWSRIHPGGKFWIDISRGTDITEAFEVHHFSNKAEAVLQNYYIREATTPRRAFSSFNEDGFYKAFKRKVSRQQLVADAKPSFFHFLVSDVLAFAVFLTGLLGVKYGIAWTIVSGVFLGILSTSCHTFLHMKHTWRVNYFNLSLMSSREWKIRHVLGHHQYRDTALDLEIPVWQPLPKVLDMSPMLTFLLFPFAAHIQFLQRCLDVFLSRKLRFDQEELIAFTFPLFLFFFGGVQPWTVFLTWNKIVFIGSFTFCLLNFPGHQSQESAQGKEQDFGVVQLKLTGSNPKENESVFSFLNAFRGNALHYLCPPFSCGSLSKLIPVFEETVKEFCVSDEKSSPSVLDALQNAIPQGHVFFS